MADYSALEAVLGYTFRDRSLIEQALRHASWCNEQPVGPPAGRGEDDARPAGRLEDSARPAGRLEDHARPAGRGEDDARPAGRLEDNERLEFLGDAVLDLVVGHRLMSRYPQLREGQLSVTRAQVVSEAGLSEVAGQLGLGEWLMLGKGEEKSGGRTKPSILADAFEAILAAVYLDGGFTAAWDLVGRLLAQRIETVELKGFYDFKTRLQETAQARLKATPTYRVVQETGPDHDKRFVVAVAIGDDEWSRAVGRSKKEAEQIAAADAHFRLEASTIQPGRRRR